MSGNIRNFAIIAHIDHGKSTLADRFLELAELISPGSKPQALDSMELEREKGITIKLQPVRMTITSKQLPSLKSELIINLIDTPGHADFSYEVSRSLACVDGALLLVDATKGVQAQTITNLSAARQLGLKIIPVINKIDLPDADIDNTISEIKEIFNCPKEDICLISAKTGEGMEELVNKIIKHIPPTEIIDNSPLKAMIFDSYYDNFRGVIVYVRIFQGRLDKGSKISFLATDTTAIAEEIGYCQLKLNPASQLSSGEIGYIITGLKDIKYCQVGDTICLANQPVVPLSGYKPPKTMVWASFYPESNDVSKLISSLEKLQLNDAACVFEPIASKALGAGVKVGSLGLLHLEIIKERLKREYTQDIIITSAGVDYKYENDNYLEPWIELEIITPSNYYGAVIELLSSCRGNPAKIRYISNKAIISYHLPLLEIIGNFYDRLKSVTNGYASMDYQLTGYQTVDLVRLNIIIAGEFVDSLSQLIPREIAIDIGRKFVDKLKNILPRQNFQVSIQASIADPKQGQTVGKIIARENIAPYRKDVTAKLYGGDVTRKRKLLEKQKRGKEKMRSFGKIRISNDIFFKLYQ